MTARVEYISKGRTEENRGVVIDIAIPGKGGFRIDYLILDLNGTIAVDGALISGVRKRLKELSELVDIIVVTADTHQNAERLLNDLPVSLHRIEETEESAQKERLVLQKGKDRTICVGNGRNDVLMLKESAIGICIVGTEGASGEAVMSADLVVKSIDDALDLLLKPHRMKASLRR
ncbi:MAG: HAD family hydrolase [Thermodesulfobacteriota bacterium]